MAKESRDRAALNIYMKQLVGSCAFPSDADVSAHLVPRVRNLATLAATTLNLYRISRKPRTGDHVNNHVTTQKGRNRIAAMVHLEHCNIATLHRDLSEVEAYLEVHNKASALHSVALLRGQLRYFISIRASVQLQYSVRALFNPNPVRILSHTKKPTLVRTLVERIITPGFCALSSGGKGTIENRNA